MNRRHRFAEDEELIDRVERSALCAGLLTVGNGLGGDIDEGKVLDNG